MLKCIILIKFDMVSNLMINIYLKQISEWTEEKYVWLFSSRMESISNQPTPHGSGATTPDNHSTVDTLSEQDEGTMTPPSKQTTPATSPHNSFR